MSWNERIIQGAYTSAQTQTRFTFQYEDVSRSFDNKTSSFEFPDASGTYVQSLGPTGKRYPLRMFFTGDNYDLEAAAFEELLAEPGIGRLDHPIYGSINVVPFGTISRRDDLKTAANQAVIEVTFWETITLIYPTDQDDPASDVISAVDQYNEAKAAELAEEASLGTEPERASFKERYDSLVKKCRKGLRVVAEKQENVQKQFNAIYDSINTGIDVLVRDPVTLGFQTSLLIQSPARAAQDIQARLVAYQDLAGSIISGDGAVVEPTYDSEALNTFKSNDLYAAGYLTGMVLSVVNNEFETKRQALEAAEFILDQFNDLNEWQEANYAALGLLDTGESYQRMKESVDYAAGYLVQISFTLKQERIITLDRNRTMIDLCAELYGQVDEVLDFFINSNDLTGDEIMELPKGREIVYYV